MHIVIVCLFVATLIPVICAFVGGYFRSKQASGFDNKTPRLQVAALEGAGHRAYAAQQNSWEALAMYGAALLALHISGVVIASVATLSLAFIAARVVYVGSYLANQDIVRSIAFLGSFGVCIYLFVIALAAVA